MERPVFSDMLCERRRQLGYSIRQASLTLMLREDILVAFEEGNFEQIPKSGYAQGMLASYARYLGLDAGQVVAAFTRDLDRYMREMRHQHKGEAERSRTGLYNLNTNQYGERVGTPYVTSRGLLPTSGGPAGDLGSFSTTHVRPRGYTSPESTASFAETRVSSGYEDVSTVPLQQTRPYTSRTPRLTSRTGGGSWGQEGDIRTQDAGQFDYVDDLRMGNSARNYEAASTGKGRRSSRNISDTSRPRIDRQTNLRRNNNRNVYSSNPIVNLIASGTMIVPGIVVLVVVLISVVVVVSVSSCVRKGSEARTVPVSAAIEAEQNNASGASGDASNATAADANATAEAAAPEQQVQATDPAAGTAAMSNTGVTSVSVSVASGAVTWLEIECDGVSEVADTVTGPWQHTYTVEESLTVQASDTTAVQVVQNGNQVQFESMASGIGTLRVEGTKPATPKSDEDKGKDKESPDTQTEGDGSSSAHMGNNAQAEQVGTESQETGQTGTGGEGYDTGGSAYTGESDYGYGYDDYGYSDYSDYGYDDYGSGYDEYGYDSSYDEYGYDYSEEYY